MPRLRPYETDDAEPVLAIWWDSWHSISPGLRHPQTLASWRSRWIAEIVHAQRVVVVEDDLRVPLGFAAAHLPSRELTQLFVSPAYKGRGIGRMLLRWAQDEMATGFKLHTLTFNLGSRQFYEKHGLIEGVTQTNPVNNMQVVRYQWVPPLERTGI